MSKIKDMFKKKTVGDLLINCAEQIIKVAEKTKKNEKA